MSNLLKMARAAGGDVLFEMRVQAACELAGVAFDRGVLLRVAREVVDGIELSGDDGLTVSTEGVSDVEIIAAVGGMGGGPVG